MRTETRVTGPRFSRMRNEQVICVTRLIHLCGVARLDEWLGLQKNPHTCTITSGYKHIDEVRRLVKILD